MSTASATASVGLLHRALFETGDQKIKYKAKGWMYVERLIKKYGRAAISVTV